MIYDYIIVGLGPTGLTLGLNLLKTNNKVLFIESESGIGGCWKTNFTNDGYFTEHSPKVLSKTGSKEFNKLLHYLNIEPQYKEVYDKKSTSFLENHVYTMFNNFSILDIVKLIFYVLLYILTLNNKHISIQEWCKNNNISKKSQSFLNIRSIAISNTYDKLTMNSFIKFFFQRYQYIFHLQQLYNPVEWLNAIHEKFKSNPNFTILLNTKVKEIIRSKNDNSVSGVLTHLNNVFHAKQFVCCIPLRPLYKIMHASSNHNWFSSMDYFKTFVDHSTYTGIGFQLHFNEKVKLPSQWCWSCLEEWKVIVIDKTNHLKNISQDPDIKQVLSCVVVDLDTKSSVIQKTANECDNTNEIVKEAIRQLNKMSNHILPSPKKITLSNNMYRSEHFGWESLDSSFSYSKGKLPYKGSLKNLYSVGPHNHDEVVVIETAIQSAKKFSKDVIRINNVF
jgi:hypothetical protein|uniref:Amine oxidase domain-containing protein n=1 Tax=viral metagenome TaxID=1070528 RepID=A0A6C0BRS2_9ZZZZ